MIDGYTFFEMMFDLFDMLLKLSVRIYDFLFTKQTIGLETIDLGLFKLDVDWSISFVPFWSLGGAVVITMITLYLIKTFIPIA